MEENYKPKIFLIDDHHEILKQIGEFFRENNFEVLTDDAKESLEAITNKIAEFGPHVLLSDMVLSDKFSGVDVIKKAKRLEKEKVISRLKVVAMSFYGDSKLVSSLDKTPVDKAVSKAFSLAELMKIVDGLILDLGQEKKQFSLRALLRLAKHKKINATWQNIVDVKGSRSPGSHILFTRLDQELRDIRLIGLRLGHTYPRHGSCLSVSFGCPKSCPVCASGTKEIFKRNYTAGEMAAMQELVMRECVFYDENFWLYDMPFFTAFMGQGDIAFNFEETIKAAEIIKHVFGDRFACNLSTAFRAGIEKLISYANTSIVPRKILVPNLQISVHAPTVDIRRRLLDSEEDPKEVIRLGQKYARLSGTKLTVNYGLTSINSEPEHIKPVLKWLDPDISRIKFSLMVIPDKKQKLKPAGKRAFALASELAKASGIEFELFNEQRQMGLETGASCGTLINKII